MVFSSTNIVNKASSSSLGADERGDAKKAQRGGSRLDPEGSSPSCGSGFKMPFAVVITLEVFFCCFVVTAVLIGIVVTANSESNSICFESSAMTVKAMAIQVQERLGQSIMLQINEIVDTPTNTISSLMKLFEMNIIDPSNGDVMIPYLYRVVKDLDYVSTIYYASESTMNFIGVGKFNYEKPYVYNVLVEDNLQRSVPPRSACPTLCPQNLTSNSVNIFLLEANGVWTNKTPIASVPNYEARTKGWYQNAVAANTSRWTLPYVYSDAERNVGITASHFVRDANGTLLGVLAVDITLKQLTTNLKSLALTPNGFAVIFNTERTLFASSAKEALSVETFDPATNKTVIIPRTIDKISDPTTSQAIKELLRFCNNNLTSLPPNNTYTLPNTNIIFQHTLFRDPSGLSLIMLLGAPLSDHTTSAEVSASTLRSKMQRSELAMIAIGIGTAVLLVALSVPVTYWLVGWPMVGLAKHIQDAGKFDFSALHGVDRSRRSYIKEIAIIEESFWAMITKFVMGLQKQKETIVKAYAATPQPTAPPPAPGATAPMGMHISKTLEL
ncbi:hypothetical protein HDV05_004312 [Chytridiales sp. JEL 0842]|nr:hypothetical protein HDV05_004312 [Chytridiales sp. JEL 0842]